MNRDHVRALNTIPDNALDEKSYQDILKIGNNLDAVSVDIEFETYRDVFQVTFLLYIKMLEKHFWYVIPITLAYIKRLNIEATTAHCKAEIDALVQSKKEKTK